MKTRIVGESAGGAIAEFPNMLIMPTARNVNHFPAKFTLCS